MSTKARQPPHPARLLVCVALAVVGCGTSSALPTTASPLAAGACPRDALCFNLLPSFPGVPVRLLVLWNAPNEKGVRQIVELARLTGTERSLSVPLATIAPPRATSMDLGMSWGYVFAVPLSAPDDVQAAAGMAQMMLVHAMPGWRAYAVYVRDKFPAGVAEGTAPYLMKSGGRFDNFVLAPPGSVFELVFCPATQPVCPLPMPNPS